MSNKIWDGRSIHQFWKDSGLSHVLRQFVYDHDVSYVWSLLPDAQEFPYYHIFRQFWLNPEDVKCYWVKVFLDNGASAGAGSGRKRGEWLNEIMMTNPAFLYDPELPPKGFINIPGVQFCYAQA
jgi:hypothetical protein